MTPKTPLLALSLVATAYAGTDYSTKCTVESPCEAIETLTPEDTVNGKYTIYTTSQDGDRLTKVGGQEFQSSDNGGWQKIVVDTAKSYQTVLGFGGALTDAAAITVNKMEPSLQEAILRDYYTPDGLEYTVGRIPMASCDFSTGVYSYDDTPEDFALDNFSIDVDSTETTGNKLAFVQRVLKMTTSPLSLFASPWAPPAWMTKTNSTVGSSTLRDEPEIHSAWALYFSKFFAAYRDAGIDFWGVTVQNEPAATMPSKWQDLKLSAEDERDFVKNFLGPQLRATDPDLKIIMLDDQRTHITDWTDTILGDPDAAQYVDGIGLHWYAEVNDWFAWATKPFKAMSAVADKFPDKFMLATEACNGFIPVIDQGPKLGDWGRAERYGFDILRDMNAFAVGWTDWNIVLDMTGGPNWANNEVDAPILADIDDTTTYYRNPMYYYLGHFAKFVRPGSKRIGVESTGNLVSAPMEATGYLGEDGKVVLVVMNRDVAGHKYFVEVEGKGFINVDVAAHSIQTIVWEN
jgi:glucosylceramidase